MKKSPPWTPTYKNPRFVSCIRLLGPAADNASLRFAAVVVAVVSAAHESRDPNRNPRRHDAGCNGYAQGLMMSPTIASNACRVVPAVRVTCADADISVGVTCVHASYVRRIVRSHHQGRGPRRPWATSSPLSLSWRGQPEEG